MLGKLAQLSAARRSDALSLAASWASTKSKSTRCPSGSTEKVARLHLVKSVSSSKLTQMSDRQAAYIGLPVEGPYKREQYRY
jgi:adenosylhomocysteinase